MLSLKEESFAKNPRTGSVFNATWFYLSAEFLIGAAISGILAILSIVKSILPKPPRDLTGDVVLVTGVTSILGRSLAEEFTKAGCSVICVDKDVKAVEETAIYLKSQCTKAKRIPTDCRKHETSNRKQTSFAYGCNLMDRDEILNVAKKIKDEVGQIDILVTCVGNPDQDVLDTVSTTLMSHYWTVLAFLPSMIQLKRAHIVGVTPTVSTQDAYMGSRAAIVGLMESLGQEFNNDNSHLTFITVAPKAESRYVVDETATTRRIAFTNR